MEISNPIIIDLPKIIDKRGNLSFLEENNHLPFCIQRTYWLYDVPGGEYRGGHAFVNNNEFVIALSGSFDVIIDDGIKRTEYSLNRSYYGLFIPKSFWREFTNFSTNSVALILASEKYIVSDYIRDYEEFLKLKK